MSTRTIYLPEEKQSIFIPFTDILKRQSRMFIRDVIVVPLLSLRKIPFFLKHCGMKIKEYHN